MQLTDKLRESVLFYVKMDLALFAFLATVMTVLKLERPQIFEFLYNTKYILIALGTLLSLGLLQERLMLFNRPNTAEHDQRFVRSMQPLLWIQTALHCGLVMFSLGLVTATVEFEVAVKRDEQTLSIAKTSVTDFYNKRRRLPANLSELAAGYESIDAFFKAICSKKFEYKRTDSLQYSITLPGTDEKIGTGDDWRQDVVLVIKDSLVGR